LLIDQHGSYQRPSSRATPAYVRPPEQHPRRIIDDDDNDDEARRVALTLEDGLLFRIAEFLGPGNAELVCKLFSEAATKTAGSVLNTVESTTTITSTQIGGFDWHSTCWIATNASTSAMTQQQCRQISIPRHG